MTATLTTLATFDGPNGEQPSSDLSADANGDLFGTTAEGVANGGGTVFEIVKSASRYASTPTTLASFDYIDGARPEGSLTVDANGDLFGTSERGGVGEGGPPLEIVKTPRGFAGTADQL
jgi:hypothetical protein